MGYERTPHVHEAVLRLEPDTDFDAVGAAVTVELCGAVDHDGPCRWPNNHALDLAPGRSEAVFRTLFVAPEGDVEEISGRISSALRSAEGWTVVSERRRPLTSDEEAGAEKLARTGRRPG
jgi:hypothetical protein